MLYRPLGKTGLTVSEIGFGAASFWGHRLFDERKAARLVHAAIDGGVTLFDTGASYSRGAAEPRLGKALRGRNVGKLVVATKAGTFHAGGGRIGRDFSPAAIVASVERSLANLGLETLPLLQLHGPAMDELTDELVATLVSLKDRGLVRALGVNSFDPGLIDHVVTLAPFDVVMVDYNVLRPEREPLIARAAAAGKGVLAGMALAMGHANRQVLKARSLSDLWYAARALTHHRADVVRGARMGFLAESFGMTAAQAALGFVLANRNVASAVVGTTRLEHLAENLAASGQTLPPAVALRVRGLA